MSSNDVAEALWELLPEVRRPALWVQVLAGAVVAMTIVGLVAMCNGEPRGNEARRL